MSKLDKLIDSLTERVSKELKKEDICPTDLKQLTLCAAMLKDKELRQQENDKSN